MDFANAPKNLSPLFGRYYRTPGPTPSIADSASASRFRQSGSAIELIGTSPYRKTDDYHVQASSPGTRNYFDDDDIRIQQPPKRKMRNSNQIEQIDACGRVVRVYDIVEMLGKGGYAVVYEVRDVQTGERFAAKMFERQKMSSKDLENTEREVSIQKSLNHKNIVRLESCFTNETHIVLILELCRRESLFQLSKQRGAFAVAEVRRILGQVCSGIHYLHSSGVLHRDIKLGNLLIGLSGEVKIADFGFAIRPGQSRMTDSICGTPNYMAPEILMKECYGFPVDIWSTGVTLFALAFGRPPFESADTKRTYERIRAGDYEFPSAHNFPRSGVDLIERMLHRSPHHRPSAEDVMRSAFLSLEDLAPHPRPLLPSARPSPQPATRRHPPPSRVPDTLVVSCGYCSKYGFCCRIFTFGQGATVTALFNDNTKLYRRGDTLHYITRVEVEQGGYMDRLNVLQLSDDSAPLSADVRKKQEILKLLSNKKVSNPGSMDPSCLQSEAAAGTLVVAAQRTQGDTPAVYLKHSHLTSFSGEGTIFAHRLSNDVVQATVHADPQSSPLVFLSINGKKLRSMFCLDFVLFGQTSAAIVIKGAEGTTTIHSLEDYRGCVLRTERGELGFRCDDGDLVSFSGALAEHLASSFLKAGAWSKYASPFD